MSIERGRARTRWVDRVHDQQAAWIRARGLSVNEDGYLGMLGAFGVGAGAVAAPVLGSFGAGVGIGKYGSDVVKDLGWMQDDEGNNLKPSE